MAISADSEQLREGRPFDPYGAHRDDPYSFLADIGDAEPVFYAPLLDAWCVTRREDMVAVLRDDRSFSARDHNPRPAVELPEDVSRMFRTWRGAGRGGRRLTRPSRARQDQGSAQRRVHTGQGQSVRTHDP